MQQWGFRSSAECPRCDETESTLHVMRCKSESAKDEFYDAIEPLAEWLVAKAPTEIGQAIIEHAVAGRENRDARTYPDWADAVKYANLKQVSAGCRSMVEGLPTRHWRHII